MHHIADLFIYPANFPLFLYENINKNKIYKKKKSTSDNSYSLQNVWF